MGKCHLYRVDVKRFIEFEEHRKEKEFFFNIGTIFLVGKQFGFRGIILSHHIRKNVFMQEQLKDESRSVPEKKRWRELLGGTQIAQRIALAFGFFIWFAWHASRHIH